MNFFHCTTKENAAEIFRNKKIEPTKYNFPRFMDRLLDNISIYDSYNDFPDRWLGMPEIPPIDT